MSEGRVTSANQKNVYLESKNYETKYKNIISEKFTDELTTSIRKTFTNEAEKFNYDEEVKLLDRNSSIYEYIDIFLNLQSIIIRTNWFGETTKIYIRQTNFR